MSARKILAVGATAFLAFAANASSHREAPFVAMHPAIDGTDFYMFDSYDPARIAAESNGVPGYVTILANYNPLQDPYGGPNYFALDPDALYEINIDNNGDGVEDITFQFQFQSAFGALMVPTGAPNAPTLAIPLIDLPPAKGVPTLNRVETYTANVVRGGSRTGTPMPISNAAGGGTTFTKPVDNIGNKSIPPPYSAYANQYIYSVNIPGCATPTNMFVGQRREGFLVNLGEVFDLVNFVPVAGAVSAPNAIADKNITTIAMEVPIACLTADSLPASTTKNPVIGGWTVSSLRQARVQNPNPQGPVTGSNASGGTAAGPEAAGGAWTQVSRLGSPLVNELVIGITDKDKFNASHPVNDVANFANYVEYPTLPVLLSALFCPNGSGSASCPANVPPTPRLDLVEAFLTGVPGFNASALDATAPATAVPAEELRLNVTIPPTAAASQYSLGALPCVTAATGAINTSNAYCDVAGFPNGRRPGDDVVDIELRVAEGALLGATDPNMSKGVATPYSDGVLPYGANGAPSLNAVNTTYYQTSFPYLNPPIPGSPNGTPPGPTANGLPADGT